MEGAPTQEKRKETHNPEQIRKIFEMNPELSLIGNERDYEEYIATIFPESCFKEIVWHNSHASFKDDGFKPMQPNFDTVNSIEGIYNFTTSAQFAAQYGPNSYPVVLNIRAPYTDTSSGEYGDDMDMPLSEALIVIGKQSNQFGPRYDPAHAHVDSFVNTVTGEGYRGISPRNGEHLGIPPQKFVVVFDSNQIHILGSRSDIEGFKKYAAAVK